MLGRIKSAKLVAAAAAGVAAVLVLGGGSAAARSFTTGADVKNGSLHLVDLDNRAQARLHGETGDDGARGGTGAQGAQGKDGHDGDDGDDAQFVGADWSIMDRNVIGNGDSYLRAGPDGGTGQGSLGIRTGSSADASSFGNQTRFLGDLVGNLNHVGFSVFTTGENRGLAPNNMPSIGIEIDPNVIGSSNFSTLVYAPDNSAAGAWTSIDAAADPGKHWGLTGTFFNAQPDRCGLNGARCTFQEVKDYLAANNDVAQGGAAVLTVSIKKGRDFAFSGAADNLRINNTVFDFEPLGVTAHSAT